MGQFCLVNKGKLRKNCFDLFAKMINIKQLFTTETETAFNKKYRIQ